MLRLFLLNVFGGPEILNKFIMPEKDVEEIYCTKNFALFSSQKDINFWERHFESVNFEYSYLVLDVTNNVSSIHARGYLDSKMKHSEDIIKLLQKFGGERREDLQESKLNEILDKINNKGLKSLDEEEKEFLKNLKEE